MSDLIPAILFEDTHLIVLNKPAGLLSQGEHTGDDNVVDWLRRRWGRPYVGLIHRLDRNTSGVMIVAKRTKSAQRLTRALQEGKLQRTYLGWVRGSLKEVQEWHHTLIKDEARNKVRVAGPARARPGNAPSRDSESSARAKAAVLLATPKARVMHHGVALSLVEFKLETGRSHQIRAQSAHEGFPILGDRKYGSALQEEFIKRPALHSHRLRFPHPMSGEEMEFTAPLPEDMNFSDLRDFSKDTL